MKLISLRTVKESQLFLLTVLLGVFTLSSCADKSSSVDKYLEETAKTINASCPMMLDREIRMDSVTTPVQRSFKYNYTLVNLDRDSVDVEVLKTSLDPVIASEIRDNMGLKYLRDNDVTVTYSYNDKNRKHLFDLTYNAGDYKEANP